MLTMLQTNSGGERFADRTAHSFIKVKRKGQDLQDDRKIKTFCDWPVNPVAERIEGENIRKR